jgi:MFS family permease
MAIYSLAPLLGPVVGPVAGAWIAQLSTWRWVFWSTTILDAIIQTIGVFALQETYPPVLLERKAAALRKELGLSDDAEKGPTRHVRTAFEDGSRDWQTILSKALMRPFALIVHEPIIQVLGTYMAFIYGTFYLFLTTLPDIFHDIYGQRTGIAGLHYIALGVGLTGASQLNARTMDRIYRYFTRTRGVNGQGRPEFRLPSMIPGTILLPAGILIAGWCVEYKTHWIGPDIGIALVGAGMILNFQSIQTYVVDGFTLHAASALAAVSVLRSLAGFGFPLFAPAMFRSLGYGKGDTILAVVAIVIGCPAPLALWVYGERLRQASRHAKS